MWINKKFSKTELKGILYDYMILKQPLMSIYQKYKDRCNNVNFNQIISSLLNDDFYKTYICNELARIIHINPKVPTYEALGSKKESYWETEEDLIRLNSTYESLSLQERIIYNEQEKLENQKQRDIATWM